MPEVVVLQCDAPKCPNTGTAFLVKTDKGGERRVIVCDDHQLQPFRTVVSWARAPVAPRRRSARPSGTSRERLLDIKVDD